MEETVDFHWLCPDRYLLIVDVGAFIGAEGQPVIFVRPAKYELGPVSDIWKPEDLGNSR